MTPEQFNQRLNEIVPARYRVWKEKPPVPFAVFYEEETENFAADGIVYMRFVAITIELYTREKRPELEQKIEMMLDENKVFWDRLESYIDSEKLLMVSYSFTVKGE